MATGKKNKRKASSEEPRDNSNGEKRQKKRKHAETMYFRSDLETFLKMEGRVLDASKRVMFSAAHMAPDPHEQAYEQKLQKDGGNNNDEDPDPGEVAAKAPAAAGGAPPNITLATLTKLVSEEMEPGERKRVECLDLSWNALTNNTLGQVLTLARLFPGLRRLKLNGNHLEADTVDRDTVLGLVDAAASYLDVRCTGMAGINGKWLLNSPELLPDLKKLRWLSMALLGDKGVDKGPMKFLLQKRTIAERDACVKAHFKWAKESTDPSDVQERQELKGVQVVDDDTDTATRQAVAPAGAGHRADVTEVERVVDLPPPSASTHQDTGEYREWLQRAISNGID